MNRERGMLKQVHERDVDMALIQLFRSSQAFTAWFCNQLDIEGANYQQIWHSFVREVRESDIELSVESTEGQQIILIENKINAEPQPKQAEDYYQRGEKYVQEHWDNYEVCLVAPENYVEEDDHFSHKFDNILYYEQIHDWIQESNLGSRPYLNELFAQAQKEGKRGYIHKTDDKMTNFLRYYWELTNENYPCLQPKKPDSASSNSWFRINPPSLDDAQLIHKMKKGRVELQLSKSDYDLGTIREEIDSEQICAVDNSQRSSYFVRGLVPKIDDFKNPVHSKEVMLEALAIAAQLREYYLDVFSGNTYN